MEIWNNGTLPAALSLSDLKRPHQSVPRNADIARIFYLRHYVEIWGTGTNQMIALCQQANLPEPIFEENSGGLLVTFPFDQPISNTQNQPIKAISIEQSKIAILEMLKDENLSSSEIHQKISRHASIRTIKSDLGELQKLGKVKQIGRGRNTRWKAKK